jgi:hypothetical protein
VRQVRADSTSDLSLHVGAIVTVVEAGDNKGWWFGKSADGETGLFPVAFTEPL